LKRYIDIVYILSQQKAKNFYREVDNIRKRFKPRTLLVRNTECNIASNKEKVLHRW